MSIESELRTVFRICDPKRAWDFEWCLNRNWLSMNTEGTTCPANIPPRNSPEFQELTSAIATLKLLGYEFRCGPTDSNPYNLYD